MATHGLYTFPHIPQLCRHTIPAQLRDPFVLFATAGLRLFCSFATMRLRAPIFFLSPRWRCIPMLLLFTTVWGCALFRFFLHHSWVRRPNFLSSSRGFTRPCLPPPPAECLFNLHWSGAQVSFFVSLLSYLPALPLLFMCTCMCACVRVRVCVGKR